MFDMEALARDKGFTYFRLLLDASENMFLQRNFNGHVLTSISLSRKALLLFNVRSVLETPTICAATVKYGINLLKFNMGSDSCLCSLLQI